MNAQNRYSFTPDDLRAALHLDEDTGMLTWKHRLDQGKAWNSRWAGKPAFTSRHSEGYLKGFFRKTPLLAHRVVFAIVHGRFPTQQIDHIDGDKGNNRPSNLREASLSQQQMNTVPRRGTSNFKGVSRHSRSNSWQAHIKIDGKARNLGQFASEMDAAKAYDDEAARAFGAFAVLNFGGRVNV